MQKIRLLNNSNIQKSNLKVTFKAKAKTGIYFKTLVFYY